MANEVLDVTGYKVITTENADKIAGLTIRKATDFATIDTGLHMTIYGQGGAGKTTLLSDVVGVGRTLLFDAEGGVDSVSDVSGLDVAECFTYKDFKEFTEVVKLGKHGFKNIIIDNLCEIIDKCTYSVAGPSPLYDLLEFKEWNQVTREIKFRTREWRDIARKQGINVFFTAWDADEKDDRGVLKKDLAFSPSLRREFPGIVTIIGHVRVLDDPTKRMLDFAPSPKTVSKFRRNRSEKANRIPFQITYDRDHLPMADIIRTIKGEIDWPKKYESNTPDTARNSRSK